MIDMSLICNTPIDWAMPCNTAVDGKAIPYERLSRNRPFLNSDLAGQ
jgi:hypothetical protein